jgi:hypothetical protein
MLSATGPAARADDRSSPDLIALRANVVTHVRTPTFESAYGRGRSMDRERNAIARLGPALLEH